MDRVIAAPWWRRRRIVLWIGVVAGGIGLLLTVVALFGASQRSLKVRADGVTIATVSRGLFRDATSLQGKIVPRDVVFLDAQEGGQVEKLLVQAGDVVTAGQPVIALRNTQLELDVLQQEGRLVESITQLQTFEKGLEQTRAANEAALATIDYNVLRLRRSVERAQPLAAKGFYSQADLDRLQDELAFQKGLRPVQADTNQRQEELRLRQAPQIASQLASLQQSLRITREKLNNLMVRAPVAGQVTALDLRVGQNRNRGERLAEITPATGFKVEAEVDQFYLGRLRVGQVGSIDLDGQRRELRVARIYPQVRSGTFTVDLDFVGATPAGLIPGTAVTGSLSLGADSQAVLLPNGPFLDKSGGDWVFVVEADGHHAERRRIKIGRRSAEQLEVLSGLKPGERAITSDYSAFERIERIDLRP